MSYSEKRRFIAGAVCPKCGAADKLVVYVRDGQSFRECIACDYKDTMHLQSKPRELDTRVNQTEEKIRSETQVITLLGSLDDKKDNR